MTPLATPHHFGRVQHLLLDLHACAAPLTDPASLSQLLIEAAARSSAKVVGQARHEYTPHGLTLIVFLEESHLLLTTWPEHRFAIAEVLLCNEAMDPEPVAAWLIDALRPARVVRHRFFHEVDPRSETG
ncbi:MAG: S-adenosylmethionine decarboxylase [Polyangiaceae bacterium]